MLTLLITLLESFLILAITVYLVRSYASHERTSLYVQILTMIGWFLGFATIIFIPLDIYVVSTLSSNSFLVSRQNRIMEK